MRWTPAALAILALSMSPLLSQLASAQLTAPPSLAEIIEDRMKAGLFVPLQDFPTTYARYLLMPWCVAAKTSELQLRLVLALSYYLGGERSINAVYFSGLAAFPPPYTAVHTRLIAVDPEAETYQDYGLAKVTIVVVNHTLYVTVIMIPKKRVEAPLTIIPLVSMVWLNTTNTTIVNMTSMYGVELMEQLIYNTVSAIVVNGTVKEPMIFRAEVEVPVDTAYTYAVPRLYAPLRLLRTDALTILTLGYESTGYYYYSYALELKPWTPLYVYPSPMVWIGDRPVPAAADCSRSEVRAVMKADRDTVFDTITVSAVAGPALRVKSAMQASWSGYWVSHIVVFSPVYYVDVFTVRLPTTVYAPAGSTVVVTVRVVVAEKGVGG